MGRIAQGSWTWNGWPWGGLQGLGRPGHPFQGALGFQGRRPLLPGTVQVIILKVCGLRLSNGECDSTYPGRSCHRFSSCEALSTCVYPPDLCPGKDCRAGVVNPTDPNNLSDDQQARAITFAFLEPTSSFFMRWGQNGELKNFGQNLFFAGSSSLIAACPGA